MISTETIINRINEEIEKLKQKDILVKVKMPVLQKSYLISTKLRGKPDLHPYFRKQ